MAIRPILEITTLRERPSRGATRGRPHKDNPNHSRNRHQVAQRMAKGIRSKTMPTSQGQAHPDAMPSSHPLNKLKTNKTKVSRTQVDKTKTLAPIQRIAAATVVAKLPPRIVKGAVTTKLKPTMRAIRSIQKINLVTVNVQRGILAAVNGIRRRVMARTICG